MPQKFCQLFQCINYFIRSCIQKTLCCFFAFFLLLLPGKSLKFFLRKSKLRASDNYSHGKCARIFSFFYIRNRVSHLYYFSYIHNSKLFHISVYHIRIGTALLFCGIRAEPAVRLITLFFCSRSYNLHHFVCISCCRTNGIALCTKTAYYLRHTRFRICKHMKNTQKLFLKNPKKLFHILFCWFLSILFCPAFFYSGHIEHGTDMIDFQHPHWFTNLLHSRFNTIMFKYFHKCLNRRKASIIYRCSCPVKYHTFKLFHLHSS